MTAALSRAPHTRQPSPRPAAGDLDVLEPWRERAACREAGIDLFFPIGTTGAAADETRRARQICAGCPVREACLDYALTTGQQYGVWGGRDEQERRLLRRRSREAAR